MPEGLKARPGAVHAHRRREARIFQRQRAVRCGQQLVVRRNRFAWTAGLPGHAALDRRTRGLPAIGSFGAARAAIDGRCDPGRGRDLVALQARRGAKGNSAAGD